MTENYYCHLKNFETLIKELKQAQIENNLEKIEEIHRRLTTFNKQCGVPITNEHLKQIIDTTNLEKFELKFLRNAPSVIMRDLEQGDAENAEIVYKAIQDFITQSKKQFTIRGDQIFEVSPDGTLKIPEPTPTPEIRTMLSDSQILLRNKKQKEEEEE